MPNKRRTSHYLTETQAYNLIGATGYAKEIGLRLNRQVTVLLAHRHKHLSLQDCTRHLTRNYALFAKYYEFEGAWAWVLESSIKNGEHAHMMFHCPTGLGGKFSRAGKRWVKRLVSINAPRGNVTTKTKTLGNQTIWVEDKAGDAFEEKHADDKRQLLYLIKGLDPDSTLAEEIQLNSLTAERGWKPHHEGSIEGKRSGVSYNINWQARSASGTIIPFMLPGYSENEHLLSA